MFVQRTPCGLKINMDGTCRLWYRLITLMVSSKMKKMKNKSISSALTPFYIVSVFLVISCKQNEITKLENSKTLKYENSICISDFCFNTSFITDSFVIFIAECDSNYFHIYNKNNLRFFKKFGTKGKAPYEFNFPFPFQTNTTSKKSNMLFDFYDLNLAQIKEIDFDRICNGDNISKCITSKLMDNNLLISNELCYLEDNKIAGQDLGYSEGLFFIYDDSLRNKSWVNYNPTFKLQKRYRQLVYSGSLCSNSETIIYASRNFDEVLFYKTDGSLIREYYFSEIEKPILSKNFSGVDYDSPLYFLSLYGTKSWCYVLRIGKSISKLKEENMQSVANIIKFSWDGEIDNVYTLDAVPNSFCVDESSNILYCIMPCNESSGTVLLTKYQLK